MEAAESGLPAYQHPSRPRRPDYFDARLDDFAALVILLTLASMTPERWRCHHGDDNYLLVSKQAIHFPKRAPLFHELAAATDAPVRRLANLLKIAATGPLDAIPPFAQVVTDPTIREIFSSSWKPGAPGLSVQAKVLRGGAWWQKPASKTAGGAATAAARLAPQGDSRPCHSSLEADACPTEHCQQVSRRAADREDAPSPNQKACEPGQPHDLTATPPAKSSARACARRRHTWRRWLLFWTILSLIGFFIAAIAWPPRFSERANRLDPEPARGERRQP